MSNFRIALIAADKPLTFRPRWASLRSGIETVLRMRTMYRVAVAPTVGLALVGLGVWPLGQAVAQYATPAQISSDGAAIKRALAHPPARIRVHPLAQSYPGPDAVRQCASWLASEYRPSGTVIVPKMRCWWERG